MVAKENGNMVPREGGNMIQKAGWGMGAGEGGTKKTGRLVVSRPVDYYERLVTSSGRTHLFDS